MGSTENTKWEEYTPSSITPITTVGIYKSNKPCDYYSLNGELCPWHGLPGKEYDPQFKVAPVLPQTWEDVQTLIIESNSNKEDDTTMLLNNDKIDLIIVVSQKLSLFYKGCLEIHTLACLTLPSQSILLMLSS